MNLVYVGGVDGRGEEAQGEVVRVGGGDGVSVEREHVSGLAIFGEGEGFGLLVAVGGDVAAVGGEGGRSCAEIGCGCSWRGLGDEAEGCRRCCCSFGCHWCCRECVVSSERRWWLIANWAFWGGSYDVEVGAEVEPGNSHTFPCCLDSVLILEDL